MGSGLSKTCGGIPETMKLDEAHVTAEVERLSPSFNINLSSLCLNDGQT